MSEPTTPGVRCDDCSQLQGHRIHRDVAFRHFHLFSIPLMDRPASDFPEGWPPGIEGVICGAKPAKTPKQQAARERDLELIRRQAWKWQLEEDQRCIVGDAPLGD